MEAAVRAPQPKPKSRPETTTRMSLARSWKEEAAVSAVWVEAAGRGSGWAGRRIWRCGPRRRTRRTVTTVVVSGAGLAGSGLGLEKEEKEMRSVCAWP
jgi:hypothetical protein